MRSRQPTGKRKKKKAKWGGGLKKSDKVKLNIGHKLFMVSEESLLRRKLVGNERLALHTGTPTNPMLDLAMSRKRTRLYPEWEQSDMSLTPGEKVQGTVLQCKMADHMDPEERVNRMRWPRYLGGVVPYQLLTTSYLPFNPHWLTYLVFVISSAFLLVLYNIATQLKSDHDQSMYIYRGTRLLYIYHISMILDLGTSWWHASERGLKYLRIYQPCTKLDLALQMFASLPVGIVASTFNESINLSSRKIFTYRLVYLFALHRQWRAIRFLHSKLKFGLWYICLEMATSMVCYLAVIITIEYLIDCWQNGSCVVTPLEKFYGPDSSLLVVSDLDYLIATCYRIVSSCFSHQDSAGWSLIAKLVHTVPVIVSFLILYGYILASMVRVIQRRLHAWHVHLDAMKCTMKTLVAWGCDETLRRDVEDNMMRLWKVKRCEQKGSSIPAAQLLLPHLREQLYYNLFKPALTHTRCLKSADAGFLTDLAMAMTMEFRAPGDVIIRRDKLRNKFIYLASGKVNVMSSLRDRSPVVCLSRGSAIGESCLLYLTRANFVLKCATYCELHILRTDNFFAMFPFHTDAFTDVGTDMAMRLNGLNDRLEYKTTKNEMERNKKIHMYTGYEYASYLNSLATKNILRSLSGLKEGPLVKRIERIKCFDQFFIDAEYGSKYFAQVVVTESYSDDPILLKFDPPWHIKVDNDLVHTWNLIVVLATLVNAIVLTYYLVFSQTYPQGLHYFSLFIWLLNLVDTFFTICLGIRREPYEDIEYGVVHVVLEGSCRKEWWLELVSILPFSIIYQGLAGGGVPTTSTLMHFNLLMKFYKVKFVVKKYLDLNVSVMTGLLTKSALLFAMYFYWTVAVNHMLTCYPYPCSKKTWVTEPTPRDQSTLSDHLSSSDLKEAVAELLHYNAMLVLGHSSGHFKGPHPVSKYDLLLALAVEILTTALILLFMAYLVATTINANSSRYDLMDLVTSWESWCRCLRVDAGLVARSRGYTRRLWSSPRSLTHLKYTTLFRHLGTSHIAKLARTRFFPSLMQCPFFKEGNRDVVSHMTRVCHWDVVPPYELICYAGMDLNNLILLTGGYAEVFLDGKRAEIIGPGSLIAGTEFFCDMRSAGSYVSLCHCEVMYVSRSKMNKIYQQYPAFYAIISVSREAARRIDEWSEMYNLVKGEEGILSPRMDALIDDSTRESASTIEARSFVLFWHRQTNKEKEAGLHSRKLNFTGVGKVFLLRAGIVPEGNFVVAWELVRIVLVAMLVFYHPMVQGLDACYELPIAYRVKSICDFLAFVDIYLRFHVGFYDKNGALIMHPTLTAAHYLRGQFLYDFLCALPLDNFMPFNISTSSYSMSTWNHLGYLYRMKWSVQLLRKKFPRFRTYFSCLFYLLVVLSIVNTLATQLVFLHCNLRKDIPETEHYARCMTCTKQWTEHLPDLTSEFPVTAGRMYAYGWYIAYSLLLNNVLLLYSPIMALDKIISVAALITGAILTVLFQSMFLVWQYEKARLVIKHTQQKRSLVRFLNLSKVKKNDYMLVERCCALWWNSGLHKSLEEVVENFSECFKEEVLCRQFVPKLRMNHFFVDSSLHLLRDIVKSCKWNVVPENMTLIDYCDVLDSIYILVGGAVRVHQKRGGAQIALLEAGSMVGNMIEKDLRRVKYSVVTSNEVVQYLHIASTEFYRILAKHDEKLYDDIATYARTHPAFFPSKHSAEEKRAIWLEHNRGDFRNEKTEPTDIRMDQFTFAKWPGMRGGLRTGMKWTLVLYIACGWHALYTCCLQGLLKPEEQAYTRLLVYLVDTIFPAIVILKLRLALLYGVDPKRGITRSRIIERYMSCIEGIVADAICLIPLDLVASYYISDYKIVPVFRFNKIFALIHMRTFFSPDLKEKSGRNMVRRLGYITLVILTMVHIYACVITSFNLSDGDTVSERIRTYLVNFSNFLCALAFHPGLFPTPGTTARTMVLVSFCIVLPYARALLISQIVVVLFLEAPSELPDFYDKFQHLKTMMEQRLMDPALCERTTNYLDNLWLSNEGVTVPKYFKRLPRTLVNNIYENRFLPIITRHKLFRDRNADFLRQLCGCVEPLIAFPGDTIATRGQKLGRIFWLERGAVTVVSNANRASRDVVEEYITRGGYFGTMQGLYPDIPYLYVYRAHTMSIVLSLEYKNWVHILKSFHSERNAIYGKLSNIHVKL